MYPETYSIWRFIHEPFPMEFHHHCLLFIHCARGRGDTHSEYVKNKINQNYHSVQIWSYQYLYGFLHGSVEQSSSSVKLRDSLIGQHVVGATPTRWCRNPPRTNHGGARGLESLVCRRREQGRQVRFAIEHVGHVHLDQVEHGFKVVDFLRWVWVLRLSGNVAGPLQWSEMQSAPIIFILFRLFPDLLSLIKIFPIAENQSPATAPATAPAPASSHAIWFGQLAMKGLNDQSCKTIN